jgi:hypothetical protein
MWRSIVWSGRERAALICREPGFDRLGQRSHRSGTLGEVAKALPKTRRVQTMYLVHEIPQAIALIGIIYELTPSVGEVEIHHHVHEGGVNGGALIGLAPVPASGEMNG